jgi:dienelactone hydrolase
VRPETAREAGQLAGKYKGDRPLLRRRIRAAYEALKEQRFTDPRKIGGIGYCFGGTTILELARSGADLVAVVSFHGGLGTPTPEDAKNIKCKVLACHGADDPNVPPKEVAAFEDEMRSADVDWQLISYGNAVHSFTDKNAGGDNSRGSAYNEKADHRSWEAMKDFFAEAFAK